MNKLTKLFKHESGVDIQINRIQEELAKAEELGMDKRTELMTTLDELLDLQAKQKANKGECHFKVDVNALVSSGVGFAAVLLILTYEKEDIISTKGMSIAAKMLGK